MRRKKRPLKKPVIYKNQLFSNLQFAARSIPSLVGFCMRHIFRVSLLFSLCPPSRVFLLAPLFVSFDEGFPVPWGFEGKKKKVGFCVLPFSFKGSFRFFSTPSNEKGGSAQDTTLKKTLIKRNEKGGSIEEALLWKGNNLFLIICCYFWC